MAADKVAAGIAAAAAPDQPRMAGIAVRLSSGRQVLVSAPVDLTEREALELVGYVARGMRDKLAEVSQPVRPSLLVPTHVAARKS